MNTISRTIKEATTNFTTGFPIFLDFAKYALAVFAVTAAVILAAFGLVYIFVELVWWAIITVIILTIILVPYFIGKDIRRWKN